MTGGRVLLAANVKGPSAWVVWQLLRESLPARIRQLQVDPHVPGDVVRHLCGTAAELEEAARQYRELVDRSRSEVADSVERLQGGVDTESESPPRWVDTSMVAASLGCSERWVTQLCLTGRLAAVKRGRSWLVDVDSVEDYRRRGFDAA